MKKNNDLKRFVLTGILLFSGYFGFAQTAIIRIISFGNESDVDCYELEYKKAGEGEDCWRGVGVICPEFVNDDAGNLYTSYILDGLECDTMYHVRARACKLNEDLDIDRGAWGYVQFRTPESYTGGSWTWQIGPFDIICRPVMVISTALSVPGPNVDEVFVAEERENTKEAIKEE